MESFAFWNNVVMDDGKCYSLLLLFKSQIQNIIVNAMFHIPEIFEIIIHVGLHVSLSQM